MSIWKRIGEALSALLDGEALSSVLERLNTTPERTVAFTIAIIALSAKMAKADGQVTRDEVSAFRRIFTIAPGEEVQAARVFNLARTDVAGFDAYARQIARMFQDRPEMLVDLMDGLVTIAVADGEYHPGEDAFLLEVTQIFGLTELDLRRIKARHLPDVTDPYMVLGVEPDTTSAELRLHWRQLVRDLHPDRMIGRGVPVEAQRIAEQRLAAVNDAYEMILAERKRAEMTGVV
ncbi:MAG: TerB family tellurite resistance protein [Paracoccaceae bacterium]